MPWLAPGVRAALVLAGGAALGEVAVGRLVALPVAVACLAAAWAAVRLRRDLATGHVTVRSGPGTRRPWTLELPAWSVNAVVVRPAWTDVGGWRRLHLRWSTHEHPVLVVPGGAAGDRAAALAAFLRVPVVEEAEAHPWDVSPWWRYGVGFRWGLAWGLAMTAYHVTSDLRRHADAPPERLGLDVVVQVVLWLFLAGPAWGWGMYQRIGPGASRRA